jgi:hypothetical protein
MPQVLLLGRPLRVLRGRLAITALYCKYYVATIVQIEHIREICYTVANLAAKSLSHDTFPGIARIHTSRVLSAVKSRTALPLGIGDWKVSDR